MQNNLKNYFLPNKEYVLQNNIKMKPKVAVHLHLFYVDLLEEFIEYFNNIPFEFALYISCQKSEDIELICKKAKMGLKNAVYISVKTCPNRGRDIAPLYVSFGKELQEHEIFLHVHSKKSKHIQTGGGDWRVFSLDTLLGSGEQVREIMELFDNKNAGLIYPDWHPDIPMIGYSWMGNRQEGRRYLEGLGIEFRDELFSYPTGSFFWARTDALRDVFHTVKDITQFPEEAGQIDGTFAHVLERAIAFVCEKNGYRKYIIDSSEKRISEDYSKKPFKNYFLKDRAKEYRKFDTISFEVWDTLLKSKYENYSQIWNTLRDKYDLDDTFVQDRVEAEIKVKDNLGVSYDLVSIYDVLRVQEKYKSINVYQLAKEEKEMYFDSLECRQDVYDIYEEMINEGKEIIVISESVFSKEEIDMVLNQHGYCKINRIISSADYGYGKANEHLWNIVFAEYNQETLVHSGSNVHADWYTLEKRGAHSLFIMNERDEQRYR